jgi:hypothetical protein
LIPSGIENRREKMVEGIRAEPRSVIATSIIVFELQEFHRTRGES